MANTLAVEGRVGEPAAAPLPEARRRRQSTSLLVAPRSSCSLLWIGRAAAHDAVVFRSNTTTLSIRNSEASRALENYRFLSPIRLSGNSCATR
jgi:hypothetical protein